MMNRFIFLLTLGLLLGACSLPERKCSHCAGSGTATCSSCRGEGKQACATCHGMGFRDCGNCIDGKAGNCGCCCGGKPITAEVKAAHSGSVRVDCNGLVKVACRICGGDGKVKSKSSGSHHHHDWD